MIFIPGFRPAGIYTAGLAQYLVNIEGYLREESGYFRIRGYWLNYGPQVNP